MKRLALYTAGIFAIVSVAGCNSQGDPSSPKKDDAVSEAGWTRASEASFVRNSSDYTGKEPRIWVYRCWERSGKLDCMRLFYIEGSYRFHRVQVKSLTDFANKMNDWRGYAHYECVVTPWTNGDISEAIFNAKGESVDYRTNLTSHSFWSKEYIDQKLSTLDAKDESYVNCDNLSQIVKRSDPLSLLTSDRVTFQDVAGGA